MYNPSGIGMIMAPDGDANTLEFEPAGIFSRFGQAALSTPTSAKCKRKMVIADCLRNLHPN